MGQKWYSRVPAQRIDFSEGRIQSQPGTNMRVEAVAETTCSISSLFPPVPRIEPNFRLIALIRAAMPPETTHLNHRLKWDGTNPLLVPNFFRASRQVAPVPLPPPLPLPLLGLEEGGMRALFCPPAHGSSERPLR